jgi:hypothetical protein
MDEPASTSTRWQSGWGLWLMWTSATCLGALVTGLLTIWPLLTRKSTNVILALGAVLPFAILMPSGAAQHFALRLILPGENRWCRETLVGTLVGLLMGVLLALGALYPGVARHGSHIERMAGWLYAAAIALLIGLLVPLSTYQRRVLRRHSRRAGWWLLACPFGWITGIIVAVAALAALGGVREGVFGIAAVIAVSLVMGVLVGGITGSGLVYILRTEPRAVAQDAEPPPTG